MGFPSLSLSFFPWEDGVGVQVGLRALLFQDSSETLLRILPEGEELHGRCCGRQGGRGLWA